MLKKPWIWPACRSIDSSAIDAGRGDQVRHQPRRDRRARLALAVLARVAEVGDHGDDRAGGGALERVDHHQQLHEVVVDRRAGRLHDEAVHAADVLVDLDVDLAVGEAGHLGLAERRLDVLADRRARSRFAFPLNMVRALSTALRGFPATLLAAFGRASPAFGQTYRRKSANPAIDPAGSQRRRAGRTQVPGPARKDSPPGLLGGTGRLDRKGVSAAQSPTPFG